MAVRTSCCSVAQSCLTVLRPHGLYHTRLLPFTISWSLLKLMSIEPVLPSNHLILCCPLLLLPSIFPSLRVFFDELALSIRWLKYWSFSFSISPSNEYSGLIYFRIDIGLISLLFKRPSRVFSSTTIWKHQFFNAQAFFIVQLSHPCITTGKTSLTILVNKVMPLLFNMLSRFVIAFFLRSKVLLISWLQSPSTVILQLKKRVCRCFHCYPIYLPWNDGTGCYGLHFRTRSPFIDPFPHLSQPPPSPTSSTLPHSPDPPSHSDILRNTAHPFNVPVNDYAMCTDRELMERERRLCMFGKVFVYNNLWHLE